MRIRRNFSLAAALVAVVIAAGCGSQTVDPHLRPLERFIAQGAAQPNQFQGFKGVRSVRCHKTKRDGSGIDYDCVLTVRQGPGTTTVALLGSWAPGAGLFVDWEHARVVSGS